MKKLLVIIAILAFPMSVGNAYNAGRDFTGIINGMEIKELKHSSFSVDNLEKYLQLTQAPDPDIMISQFIVETGWFTSKSFLLGNNISGMKVPAKRNTTTSGKIFGYAKYHHWTDSVDDFLLWLQYHGLSKGYVDHLRRKSYSQNENYYSLIMKVNGDIGSSLSDR